MSDAIVQRLRTFYRAGRVPCADRSPLHIAFDADAGHVRLGGEDSSAYEVAFPEGSFVEMIERSGIRPTETLVRVWLETVYFDPHVYPWAHRVVLSEVASHGESGAAL